MSPRAWRLRIDHLWMLLPAFLVVWMGFMHPLMKLDFWWHLKVGEVICTTRQIPRVDLFSFTAAGKPFLYQNWLGEVLYYLAYGVGGLPLLVVLNTLLLLLSLVAILHLCLEATNRLRVAVLCGLLAALTLGMYSNMRPQAYSLVLFAAFYWILWNYREGRRDYLWALPVLMAIWVNLHGAFVLGIGMIGLVLLSEAVRQTLLGSSSDALSPPALKKLALILGLTLLAALLNPEGYRVLAYVRLLQVDPASQSFVTEWQVPDIKQASGLICFFGAFFASLLVFFYARRRLSLTELGLFLAFAVLGFTALRNGIWFALIAAPLLARHLTGLEVFNPLDAPRVRSRLHLPAMRAASGAQRARPGHHGLNWAIVVCLLAFTVLLSPWVRPHLKAERWRPQLIDKGTPVGAMDYIAAHALQGNIFHPQAYGDYLIWRLWPQQRSFFDGRVHLYDEAFVREQVLIFHVSDWESRLAKYDIKYLLLPKDDKNAQAMIEDARHSANWTVLYEDDVSVLFER